MLLLMKKEMSEISLWLRMSLQRENQKEESLIFIQVMTLGQSWILKDMLVNTIQLEWFGTPTSSSPSLLFELGIAYMVIQDSS